MVNKMPEAVTSVPQPNEPHSAEWLDKNQAAPIFLPHCNMVCIRLSQELRKMGKERKDLQAQKQVLERQRRAHLAWAGKAMVASSLGLMQEAVETIRAVFLLPQKDLK